MPQQMHGGFISPDDHWAAIQGAHMQVDRRFGVHFQQIYVDERVPFGEVILGHCETVAGRLAYDEALMHPALAAHLAQSFKSPAKVGIFPLTHDKEQPMAADIEHKTFTVKREEWFVPTGSYDNQYGACWTDLMLAITYATNRLKELGEVNSDHVEPADDQIKVVPHDEHVVVRIEYMQEQK
jgi:hypothetical protein